MDDYTEPEFAAFIGIGWADRKHDICLLEEGSTRREAIVLPHRPEAIAQWAEELYKRFHGRPLAVCLEIAKGPLVNALQRYAFLILFLVNPASLAKYRETFCLSGAKDDPSDAQLALELLLNYRHKLQRVCPQSAPMRVLEQLVEQRRVLIDDVRRITNRITSALKQYYPQALDWFEDKDTLLFCDFISRWPTLRQAQRARKAPLVAFFHEHNVRHPKVIEHRIQAIATAQALTCDEPVITAYRLLVESLVQQLRIVLQCVERYDRHISELASTLDDYSIFKSFPGAGPVFASRLLAAFGERRERFAAAADVQKYVGIAPVTERSGNKAWVHWRLQCPKFQRQTFVEWAALSIPHCYWAKVVYQQQRKRGAPHQAALRALAYKWIRILYRCWRDRTPYDEATYLNALRRRGSTPLAFEPKTATPS